MRPFYGRSNLLATLRRHLHEIEQTGQGRMLTVRGRRQTGKSRLLTELVETSGLPYLYFTGVKDASPRAQLQHLVAAVHESSGPLPEADLLFAATPSNWGDALSRIAAACASRPSIVVLDEFPWAWETDHSLDGLLQNVWDKRLEASPVLLVVVGSDITMMERLSSHERPLYGRAKEVVVRPFDPGECASVLQPGLSATEVFDAYLVTGGYPRLITEFARVGDVHGFVRDQLDDENSDLVVVGQRSLDAEFPEGADARRVLSAIGAHEVGHATFSNVVGRLGDGGAIQTATTRAIRLLAEVKRVLAVDRPVGSKENTKLRRYRIDDPYLRFWFRFVEDQISHISRGRSDLATGAFERDWPTWRGKAIEPVVHDAVFRLAGGLPGMADVAQVGSWWNRTNTHEFDVVAADRRGDIVLVGSVKWREHKHISVGDVTALAVARNVIPAAGAAMLLGVAPRGAAAGTQLDITLTAADLLEAWGAPTAADL
jgi:AAA+ ATPase superfamily predicted ATPase